MSTSETETTSLLATHVGVTEDTLTVDLSDGRAVSVPLEWHPRLRHANSKERKNWRLIARGEGVQWPEIDGDVSVAALIAGRPSGETAASLQRWLATRKA
jgi:hypothetical protein